MNNINNNTKLKIPISKGKFTIHSFRSGLATTLRNN